MMPTSTALVVTMGATGGRIDKARRPCLEVTTRGRRPDHTRPHTRTHNSEVWDLEFCGV